MAQCSPAETYRPAPNARLMWESRKQAGDVNRRLPRDAGHGAVRNDADAAIRGRLGPLLGSSDVDGTAGYACTGDRWSGGWREPQSVRLSACLACTERRASPNGARMLLDVECASSIGRASMTEGTQIRSGSSQSGSETSTSLPWLQSAPALTQSASNHVLFTSFINTARLFRLPGRENGDLSDVRFGLLASISFGRSLGLTPSFGTIIPSTRARRRTQHSVVRMPSC